MEEVRTPVPALEEQRVVRPSHLLRRALRLLLAFFLFAGIFALVYWLTPAKPYATFAVERGCELILFSPDSTAILTADGGEMGSRLGPLRVRDLQSGMERLIAAAGRPAFATVLFSPDGRFLAAQEQAGQLRLWRTNTGEELASIAESVSLAEQSFWFSPDSRFLVFRDFSIDTGSITFWNIDRRQVAESLEGIFWTLIFAPDGKSFATLNPKEGNDINQIRLWRLEEKTSAPVLVTEHHIAGNDFALSPDFKTIAVASNLPGRKQIALWDLATGTQRCSVTVDRVAPFQRSLPDLRSLSFTANGQTLIECETYSRLSDEWLPGERTFWEVSPTLKWVGSCQARSAVSPDGAWLAVPINSGSDTPVRSGVKLLRTADMKEQTELIKVADRSYALNCPDGTFSSDSKMVAVSGLETLRREPILQDWLPAGWNPFAGDDGSRVMRFWDIETGKETMAIEGAVQAHFSPDGKTLAALNRDDTISLWHLPFRKPLWRVLSWTAAIWLAMVLFQQLLVRRWRRFNADCEKQPSGASPC